MDLLIHSGRVIDPANNVDDTLDVLVRDGVIAEIGRDLKTKKAKAIDATGQVVAPGLIDLHTHLRVPGQEYKETVATGTRAAAAGGFTTVCCMPNTSPPLHSREVVESLKERIAAEAVVTVAPVGAVSLDLRHENLSEMAALKECGCIGVSDDAVPVQDPAFMRRVFQYASMLELPVFLHCEKKTLVEGAAINEGRVSTLLGLKGMPREACEIALAENLILAKYTGCRIHILHVSTRGEVELVRRAKSEGVAISAEACPHHFALSDEIFVADGTPSYDTNLKMNPPLRTPDDVEAVIEGLKNGTIDAIATDHAPHARHEKEVEFDRALFGITGLETALGLTLRYLVEPGHLSLSQALSKLTSAPARIAQISGGSLTVGNRADLVVFDPAAEWAVTRDRTQSKSDNTPFLGSTLPGAVRAVIVAGRQVI